MLIMIEGIVTVGMSLILQLQARLARICATLLVREMNVRPAVVSLLLLA